MISLAKLSPCLALNIGAIFSDNHLIVSSVFAEDYNPGADFHVDAAWNFNGDANFSDFTVIGGHSVLAGMDFDSDSLFEVLFVIDETLAPGGPDPGKLGVYLYESDGNGGYKSCGRSDGEKRGKYPACRPTPGACKERGKGNMPFSAICQTQSARGPATPKEIPQSKGPKRHNKTTIETRQAHWLFSCRALGRKPFSEATNQTKGRTQDHALSHMKKK